MSFKHKVVVITGAGSGIGAAAALHFAKESANVVIVDRMEDRLRIVALKCEAVGTKPFLIKADVHKDEDANTVIKKTIDAFGKLDVLINNAGILRKGGILDGNLLRTYDEIMNTNVRAIVHLTQLATPYLIETKGNIVNISSVAANCASPPYFAAYKTSKAALNHFTNCAASELASHGVRVNAISPGVTRTDIYNAAGIGGSIEDSNQLSALERISEPEEVTNLIMYLASDKAKSVTGSNFVIDNGFLVKN